MSDLELLLKECKKQPNNITLQLIYADELQQQNYEHTAQFLRTYGLFNIEKDNNGNSNGGGGDGGYGIKVEYIEWETQMNNGLHILSIKSGYNPYVIVGWIERNDFILNVYNSRVIRIFGKNGELAQLAKNGPIVGENPTQLLELSEYENVPLGNISRIIPCIVDKWVDLCPVPKEFSEEK